MKGFSVHMFRQSSKLANVLYDIRGPVLEEAQAMEAAGHTILKLNIGNPAPFGFEAPEAIVQDISANLPVTQGYSDSRGNPLRPPRRRPVLRDPRHPQSRHR
jgi:alanine-synthesizing transaminase